MSDIIKTQRSLATKAQYQPAHQFDHLYRIICQQEWFKAALTGVLANTGARTAGVDGVTKEDLLAESSQNALVHEIEQELRDRSFRPSPVRRVYIPKATGPTATARDFNPQRPRSANAAQDGVRTYLGE
jgi:RNA-directed DNA polymerase